MTVQQLEDLVKLSPAPFAVSLVEELVKTQFDLLYVPTQAIRSASEMTHDNESYLSASIQVNPVCDLFIEWLEAMRSARSPYETVESIIITLADTNMLQYPRVLSAVLANEHVPHALALMSFARVIKRASAHDAYDVNAVDPIEAFELPSAILQQPNVKAVVSEAESASFSESASSETSESTSTDNQIAFSEATTGTPTDATETPEITPTEELRQLLQFVINRLRTSTPEVYGDLRTMLSESMFRGIITRLKHMALDGQFSGGGFALRLFLTHYFSGIMQSPHLSHSISIIYGRASSGSLRI